MESKYAFEKLKNAIIISQYGVWLSTILTDAKLVTIHSEGITYEEFELIANTLKKLKNGTGI